MPYLVGNQEDRFSQVAGLAAHMFSTSDLNLCMLGKFSCFLSSVDFLI